MNLRTIVICKLLIIICNACKTDKVEGSLDKDPMFPRDTTSINEVVIMGTSDDKLALEYFQVSTDINLTLNEHSKTTKQVYEDSLNIVIKDFDKPMLAEITASGLKPDYYFYRGNVFLIPGDTLRFEIKNQQLIFKGKNAMYNNFYQALDKNTSSYNKYPYQGNLKKHKETVTRIFNERSQFLENYIKENNLQSDLFKTTFAAQLRHEYLYNLISPPNVKADFLEDWYFNESDVLYSLFYKELENNPEEIIDLNEYFGDISLEEFQVKENFDNSPFFRMNLNNYIRNYFLKPNDAPFSRDHFLAEKRFIEDNLDGEIKLFAIKNMLVKYHEKGFGKSEQSIALFKEVLDTYLPKFTKPWYVDAIMKIQADLERYKFELSAPALESKFVNINGDTLTLKDVFGRSDRRIKVIDFWASWCPPCIKHIKEGKAFKDKLSVEHNVDWVYISPEKDYHKWLEANKKYSEILNFYNSFYLLNGRTSALAKFFSVNEIPRYIIFDQKNTIILNNAPSPSNEDAFGEVIRFIDND